VGLHTGARLSHLALLALLVAPSWAQSQDPAANPPSSTPAIAVVAPDSLAPFERRSDAAMRPATYVYQLALVRAGQTIPLGVRTVQVTDSPAGGVPGWLIAESRTGSAVPTTDSLWLARTDLTPERWLATIDRAQLGASFSRDSVFGAVQSYQGRSSFAAPVPAGTLLTPGMVERMVELLPLHLGYRAGASLLLLEMGSPRTLLAALGVERDERVRVGEGDMDCWVVTLRAGAMEERLWVSKEQPRVVRMEQMTNGGLLVSVAAQ
jgi:hypothetical protein